MKTNAENRSVNGEDSLLEVVVSKGHTLYHNGRCYPPSQRLQLQAKDASPLLNRGVVVRYQDLLAQVLHHGD